MEQYYILNPKNAIYVPSWADKNLIGELFSGFAFGSKEYQIKNGEDELCISCGKAEKADCAGYEYAINITNEGFCITAEKKDSLMRGFMSILCKIEYNDDLNNLAIKCNLIKEKPAMDFRCVHLCVFPETTLEFLQKCIRSCAAVKCSHIVLEFWGMFKFEFIKELSWKNAYTKEQLKPLINEANSLGVEIIPMFNHLGHASAGRVCHGKHVVLDQNPSLEYLFDSFGWRWKIEKSEVKEILRNVRKELMELCGNGSYFHLGYDEAYSFKNTKDYAESEMEMVEFLNEIQNELDKCGRRAIVWSDLLLVKRVYDKQSNQAADRYGERKVDDDATEAALDCLNKKIVIADWHYDVKKAPWYSAQFFNGKGFDVVCCPWDLSVENAESAICTALDNKLFGIMHTTWHTLDLGFANMIYALEACWSGDYKKYAYIQAARLFAANIQRKVIPSGGDYERSGWSKNQVIPKFC